MKNAELLCLLCIIAVGVYLIARAIAVQKRNISFSTLGLATYLVIFPISGVAGLLRVDEASRGYFDLSDLNYEGTLIRIAVCTAGLLAFGVPLVTYRLPWPLRPVHRTESFTSDDDWRASDGTRRSRRLMTVAGLVILPLAIPSLRAMSEYAASVNTERITTLSDGMARVGFTAQWITWAVSFLCLAAVSVIRSENNQPLVLALIGVSTIVIAASMNWTGGRAIIIMMTAPLIFTAWRFLSSASRKVVTVAAILGIGAAFVDTTISRTAQYSSAGFSLGRVLDWEVGRYSMSGWAIDYVDRTQLLFGQTIMQGLLQVPTGLVRFFGINAQNNLTAITNLTGADLLGNPRLQYIVPGMTAELYINFGLIGVILGFALLGLAIRWVDTHAWTSPKLTHSLATSYIGVLLLFCSFSSQSGALPNYALFTGFPVLAIAVLDRRKSTVVTPAHLSNFDNPLAPSESSR